MDWALETAILQSLIGPITAHVLFDGRWMRWKGKKISVLYGDAAIVPNGGQGWYIVYNDKYNSSMSCSFDELIEKLRDPGTRERLKLPPLESS